MNYYYIKIGRILIKIESEVSLKLDDDLQKYVVQVEECNSEIVYSIVKGSYDLPAASKNVCSGYVSVYTDNDNVYREYIYSDVDMNKNAYLIRTKKYSNRYILNLDSSTNQFTMRSKYIPLDEILAYHGGILLHSSCILYKGQAILFSAPSGTGKTTQAELWEKYAGATIVNGDRCVVMKIDGKWCACGCFYKGSSSYCENVIAPIAAIITLGQGPENKIYSLTDLEKFTALYRESIVHTWNPEYIELIADTIVECAKEIRMEHFECVPLESAVWYIENLIFNN